MQLENVRKIATTFAMIFLIASVIVTTQNHNALAQSNITINGAGATFPFPLIDTWRVQYAEENAGVSINYQSRNQAIY